MRGAAGRAAAAALRRPAAGGAARPGALGAVVVGFVAWTLHVVLQRAGPARRPGRAGRRAGLRGRVGAPWPALRGQSWVWVAAGCAYALHPANAPLYSVGTVGKSSFWWHHALVLKVYAQDVAPISLGHMHKVRAGIYQSNHGKQT